MDYDPPVSWEEQQYLTVKRENDALREQNRVLREALQEIASDIKGNPKRKQMLADNDFWAAPGEHTLRQWIANKALTATSQPREQVQHLCGARGFGQSLDDRCPGCDATSQLGGAHEI